MKKILITGQNSYIGNSLETYLGQSGHEHTYKVDKISLRDGSWRAQSWEQYDVIVHVAGIAHVDTAGASEETKKRYYEVNTMLTQEVAVKAKESGVKQFIFVSSMIVFGESSPCGTGTPITKDTKPAPVGFYGDSKWQAEQAILPLEAEDFRVAIVRPPMVYGKASKGNYPRLSKLARLTPVFPKLENKHSVIYVENLCELFRLLIDRCESGIYHPQNKELVSTAELVKAIGAGYNHQIWFMGILGPVVRFMTRRNDLCRKVFGDFYYAQELSEYEDLDYCIFDFKESIARTEGK